MIPDWWDLDEEPEQREAVDVLDVGDGLTAVTVDLSDWN